MKDRVGDLVTYIGPFDRCHNSIYKIIKDFVQWVDIELYKENQKHAYNIIYSVPITEIIKYEKET